MTGASGGVGLAVARALGARGMRLALVARQADGLRRAADSLDIGDPAAARTYPCDVGDAGEVEQVVQRVVRDFGRLDVLVNSAGVSLSADASVAETSPLDWERMFRTNVAGTFHACRAALPQLRATGGQIVNVLSLGAHRLRAGSVGYAASKYAQRALTEGLALEEAPGVRICSVSPGPVDTGIWDLKDEPPPPRVRDLMLTAADVAAAVDWLVSLPAHVVVPELRIAPRLDPFEAEPVAP